MRNIVIENESICVYNLRRLPVYFFFRDIIRVTQKNPPDTIRVTRKNTRTQLRIWDTTRFVAAQGIQHILKIGKL
jgi:hypothetical protein